MPFDKFTPLSDDSTSLNMQKVIRLLILILLGKHPLKNSEALAFSTRIPNQYEVPILQPNSLSEKKLNHGLYQPYSLAGFGNVLRS